MTNISLNIITKNEEENIKKNISWVKKCPSINEIIVVDDFSSDKTTDILKELNSSKLKVRIFKRKLNNDFSQQRNFAVSKSSNKWILSIDSDEIPSELALETINNLKEDSKLAYAFKREDIFLGKNLKFGETANLYFTRLFNKYKGKYTGQVHETWQTTQTLAKLKDKIYHNSHKDLKSFLNKINFYSDIRAQELYSKKVKTNIFQIIFYPILKFKLNYIFKLGFLDSTQGIIMALCMSLHSFLVRAKLWHLYQK